MTPSSAAPVVLADAFASFSDEWSPRIVTRVNDYDVRIAKVHGEHVWHMHDTTDKFFLVVDGELHIALREDGGERTVVLAKGAVFTVPHGVEHRPFAPGPYATPGPGTVRHAHRRRPARPGPRPRRRDHGPRARAMTRLAELPES
jgi:mannose-6-phosphate isomerase-like protein (cupin superfamily)